MKTFKLSKKSLHYRVATVYGNHYSWDNDTDLCSYIKSFIRGCIVIFLGMLAGAFMVGLLLGSLVGWLAYITLNGFTMPSEQAFAGIILTVGFILLVAAFTFANSDGSAKIKKVCNSIANRLQPKSKDTFIQLAYRSFKEKTCVRISLN